MEPEVLPIAICRDANQLVAESFLRTVRSGAPAHLTFSIDVLVGWLAHTSEKRLIGRIGNSRTLTP